MADKRDNQTKHRAGAGQEYSVEEILTEFSSARNTGSRIVQFPVPPRREEPEEERGQSGDVPPNRTEKTAQIIDLPPTGNITFEVTQRIKGLFRRAEDYADQMYRHAEPTEEERRAERYIPGVDVEEEDPEADARRRKRPRPMPKPPEDIAPAKLAVRYGKGLNGARVRLCFSLLLSALCVWLSLELPLPPISLPFTDYQLRLMGCTVLLAAVMLLCVDVIWAGLKGLFTLRPGAEALCTFSALFTLADALTMPTTGTRGDTLPCAAPACFVLLFALWGRWYKQRADRLFCRTAAQARRPYVVTMDEAKWSGRPAYCKWSGTRRGFGSQIQMPDGIQRVYQIMAPLLALACLLCALLASAGRQVPQQFLWSASTCFTAASTFSALLAYGLPYHALAKRLNRVGAALAGWAGAEHCGEGSIVLSDTDLFPPGSVKLNGIKVFGDFPNEKVVAYTATLIRNSGSGLERPFSDLMKAQNAMYRTARSVCFYETGITGVIRNQEVLVGTAAFMHLMNVALPQGLNVKSAMFCAIDGELAGVFALHYTMHGTVNPCLTTLIRNRISPLLATRDPNLIPSMLGQKFKLPVDKLEFPSVERRLELSDEDQDHDTVISAVLCREGLDPFCDAAVGAKRLRTAVRLGALFSVAGACVGVLLTFYLTYMDAYQSLSPMALLVFLVGWLVPVLVLADWVNRY